MPATLAVVTEIDTCIRLAWHNLKVARAHSARSPNAERLAREIEAGQLVDHWLDRRLDATR